MTFNLFESREGGSFLFSASAHNIGDWTRWWRYGSQPGRGDWAESRWGTVTYFFLFCTCCACANCFRLGKMRVSVCAARRQLTSCRISTAWILSFRSGA